MLRIEAGPAELVVVSRPGRARAVAVLALALLGLGALAWRAAPRASAALALAAAVVVVLRGRGTCARFDARGRVSVTGGPPFRREAARPLSSFSAARIETASDARSRRGERVARTYRARSGQDLPTWLRVPVREGDQLRRIVLVPTSGEPFPVTSWVPAGEDLEAARREIEARLG